MRFYFLALCALDDFFGAFQDEEEARRSDAREASLLGLAHVANGFSALMAFSPEVLSTMGRNRMQFTVLTLVAALIWARWVFRGMQRLKREMADDDRLVAQMRRFRLPTLSYVFISAVVVCALFAKAVAHAKSGH
jgi:hypothetical protein